MPKPRPMWMISPAKKKTPVTDSIKAELEAKATDLIENVLKSKTIRGSCREHQTER